MVERVVRREKRWGGFVNAWGWNEVLKSVVE